MSAAADGPRQARPPSDPSSIFMSVPEGVRAIGSSVMSETQLRNLIAAGRVGGITRVGRRILLHRRLFAEWWEAYTRGQATTGPSEGQVLAQGRGETRLRTIGRRAG